MDVKLDPTRQVYIKVTTAENRSIVTSGDVGGRIYEVGVWTRPVIPHSLLLVFDNLVHAQDAITLNEWDTAWGGCRIYRCYCTGIRPVHWLSRLVNSAEECIGYRKLFWRGLTTGILRPEEFDDYDRSYKYFDTPIGTLGAEAVMLIEEVQ